MKNDEAIKVFETYLTTGYVPRPYELQEASKAAIIALSSYEPLMKQPEVGLEVKKQIEELANDWHHKGFASDEDCPLCMQDLIDILWHFYELGQRRAAEMYDEIEYNRQRAEEESK